MIFNNSYNSNLTQFSKDSLNWNKITKDSFRKVSEPWESLDRNFKPKQSLDKPAFNGKSIELIKPDTCDVFGPQNSQRIIRRKLISKNIENMNPNIAGKMNNKVNKTQDYRQSEELLNYIAYETIPADRSYQTLIFETENKDKSSGDFEKDVDLITRYLNAITLISNCFFRKINSFKNNSNYFFSAQRLDAFSLKMQLSLNFTKYACFYSFPSYKQNLNTSTTSFLVLLMFTTLQIVCNYFSLTHSKKTLLTNSNKEILNTINTSSLSLLIKKYIIGQSIFANAALQAYFLRMFAINLKHMSRSDKSYVYYASQILLAINVIINIDEFIFDLLPIFLTIKDINDERSNYSLTVDEDSVFSVKSSFQKEPLSIRSEVS